MSQVYCASEQFKSKAHISSTEAYRQLYEESIANPSAFWSNIATQFYWRKTKSTQLTSNFDISKGSISTKFFEGSETNICYNLVDRHVEAGHGDRVAYLWEGNQPDHCKTCTYSELSHRVNKLANGLKELGVRKGDRVALYMPTTIELVSAMLACARIGAVHSVIFAGFSSEALADRMIEGRCRTVLTANGTFRGEKFIPLKALVTRALAICKERNFQVDHCLVYSHLRQQDQTVIQSMNITIPWDTTVDVDWHELVSRQSPLCDVEWMDAEDALFILYTSGSTGRPKGVLHTIGGYMVYTATVFKYVFDYHSEDVFFCTADIGWITGHTFNVYGSLANCATIVLFDGSPNCPTPGRFWQIVERYKVSIFYTAPTAIRLLMKFGDQHVNDCDLSSLRLLGSVGEPLNPEAWHWYNRVVGKNQCPICDTYWQSETGAPVITPIPGCTDLKPGSATKPFFGIVPAILNDEGQEISGSGEGHLVFKQAWPGVMRTVDGDHDRFEETYFRKFPGYYTTGDGAYRDSSGYYFITGRIDDLLNVSGHLLSTAEIESALVENGAIAEAAAVSAPHAVKGESLYCFIVLKDGYQYTMELSDVLKQLVRAKIGSFAVPDTLHPVAGLPKTRSGKIMRRILRKFVRKDSDLGDLSTLADPTVIRELYSARA